MKYSYHNVCNSNGNLMKNFAQETDLYVTNGHFQKKTGKLWTYISDMSGTKTQVDYIMVNKKWKNSVHNCEAYNTFSSIGSDHRIVTAKIKLSLRTSRAPSQGPNFDWTVLKDAEMKDLYTVTIRNKFESLCTEHESITQTYAHLITANQKTAEELLPPKRKKKREKTSTDPRIVIEREKLTRASKVCYENPTELNREKINKCKRNLQDMYDSKEEEDLDKMIRSVEEANFKCKHQQSWRIINDITGRKTSKQSMIKANDKKDRINKWYSHFKDLLGKEPVVEGELEIIQPVLKDLDISDEPFTKEEYASVKKSIVVGKACGPDGILPEVLKYCDLDEIVLGYANKLLEGEKPDQWSESDMKPLPKSGDLSITDNYRGIALSSVAAKLVNRMLLNRIRPKIDPLLRPNQNGFRPGRSTTAHILALRRLIEGVKSHNLKCVLVFVDFKKAFDSIHRGKMLQILSVYDDLKS